MRAYEYRCKDYSLLTPIFKKVLVTPLVGLIPWSVPANIITIISNALMYVAFYLAVDQSLLGRINFIVIPVLLVLYLIGDHLDGAQAKRTGTGSPLGEFCDHYLDAFNNGIVLYILLALFNVASVWLIAPLIFLSYLAHVIVFYEQYKTGWIIFEKIGSLEGVMLSAVLIFLGYFEPVYAVYIAEAILGLSLFELFMVGTALGALATFVTVIKRVPDITYGIWLFISLFAFTTIFGALLFPTLYLVVVLTLYASWYIGKLMQAHLIDGVERSTGLFTPVVLVLGFFMHGLYPMNTFIIVTVYMTVNILLLVYRTFMALKQHWVWKNPPKSM